MNIQSNPWSLVPTDIVVATPAASPTGFVLNGDGTVTLTTTANHGFSAGWGITAIGETTGVYNGFYYLLAVPSATTATLVPQFAIPKGSAGGGGGTVAKCLYNANIRIEDMSWQKAAAANDLLDFRDRNGLPIWQAAATGAGQQNRGKLYWVSGLTPVALASGVVIITVN